MKKLLYVTISILLLLTISVVYGQIGRYGTILQNSEVKNRWGNTSYEVEKFKNGDETTRASMAYSLINNKKAFIGKSVSEIRKQFGAPDGFYHFDIFPAYMIKTGRSNKEDSWQIVFILDNKRNVADVFVHKNCCYQ